MYRNKNIKYALKHISSSTHLLQQKYISHQIRSLLHSIASIILFFLFSMSHVASLFHLSTPPSLCNYRQRMTAAREHQLYQTVTLCLVHLRNIYKSLV